jgi:2-keto-3-deoxy-L-rhamnonate aldolase RhmA
MEEKKVLIGTWLFLNDVGVAEIIAGCGFDFVIIDMEHSPTGFGNLRNLLLSLEKKTIPFVRLKSNTPEFISSILDLGPCGIIIPRINTVEDAQTAVRNSKYFPIGQRGHGPIRVSEYKKEYSQFLDSANFKQLLWIQIESKEAVENIHEIKRVKGIDGIFIGVGDLSQSLGHLGQSEHPDVTEKISYVLSSLKDTGLMIASNCGEKRMKKFLDEGMQIFTVGADFRFVIKGAESYYNSAKDILST